jgi:hypothetical protein
MATTEVKKEKKEESLSMQRRKEQIALRNSRVLTDSKVKRLKEAKLVK